MNLICWASTQYQPGGSFDKLLRGCAQRAGYQAWGMLSNVRVRQAVEIGQDEDALVGSNHVFLGKAAFEECTSYELKGKGVTIQDIRGSLMPLPGVGWGMLTVEPELISVGWENSVKGKAQSQYYPLLIHDLARASTQPFVPEVQVARATEIHDWFTVEAPEFFSLDLEGADGNPNLVGIAWASDQAFVIQCEGQRDAIKKLLEHMFYRAVPILHNASYDIPELIAAGIHPPKRWVDTINTAALINPETKLALQAQTLTYVDGAITWKGLINHEHGPDYTEGNVGTYRQLWTDVLACLGRGIPRTGTEWYCFYNGLDTAYTYALYSKHKQTLETEGRFGYYQEIMEPIQAPLIHMSVRGVPYSQRKMEWHRTACERLVRMATKILQRYGDKSLEGGLQDLRVEVGQLENLRTIERDVEGKRGKFSQAEKLTKLRTKLRTAEANLAEGFNPVSNKQRTALLYDQMGLPEKRKRGAVGRSADEDSLLMLRSQLIRNTIKPRKPYTQEQALQVVAAMLAAEKWSHWKDNYLNSPIKDGKIVTAYAQHRASSGRLSSGVDTSDPDKGKRSRVQQFQNIPKALRDMVEPPEGFMCVGGDWSNIEWALTIYDMMQVPEEFVRKWAPAPSHVWYQQNLGRVRSAYLEGYFEELLDKFLSGEFDAHRYLASFNYRKPQEEITSGERNSCKPYTHGYNYDGAPVALAAAAGQSREVGIRVCQAHDEAFMTRLWKDWVVQDMLKRKYVQTPAGWRRYFFDLNPKPTEALGTKIQATAADLLKWTKAQIYKESPQVFEGGDSEKWSAITSTHDSFLFMAPKETAETCMRWLKAYMERPVPWLGNWSWRADVRAGRTWRDVS